MFSCIHLIVTDHNQLDTSTIEACPDIKFQIVQIVENMNLMMCLKLQEKLHLDQNWQDLHHFLVQVHIYGTRHAS